jgi:hypothetical protein
MTEVAVQAPDLPGARLTVRPDSPHSPRPWQATARVMYEGRPLAAHASGRSEDEAAELATERLRRQVRRVRDSEVALRNEPWREEDRPQPSPKPPEQRRIIPRRTYPPIPLSTVEAVRELLDLDVEFVLFRHARTGEDVVVHRLANGEIGLLFPQGSALADEDDIVVPEPSRYSEPLPFEEARTEMDVLNHRFLYFIDAADGRGKVIYLRHDGDYGLVESG